MICGVHDQFGQSLTIILDAIAAEGFLCMGEAACVIAAYQSKPSRWKVTRLTKLEKENCSKEQVMINSGRGLLPKP